MTRAITPETTARAVGHLGHYGGLMSTADPSERASAGNSVQSVVRAFGLLELMADRGGEAGVSELATALGVAPPTVHRLMRTLMELGHVRQLPSRRYALGPALIRLGDGASSMLATWADGTLRALEEQTTETANLAVLDRGMVTYIAQVASRHQMRMFTEVGRRVQPHSTGVGKALLATLSDDRVRGLLGDGPYERYTATTITTLDGLLSELAAVRERGYAIDEGEQEAGVRCVAVAVPGVATPTALSVSGPDGRMTRERASALAPELHAAARRLAAALLPQV